MPYSLDSELVVVVNGGRGCIPDAHGTYRGTSLIRNTHPLRVIMEP